MDKEPTIPQKPELSLFKLYSTPRRRMRGRPKGN